MKTIINCNEIEDFKQMGGVLKKVAEYISMPAGVAMVIGTFAPGERLKKHYHKSPTAELYYVYSGEGTVILDGENIEVKKGTVLHISPEKEHCVINTGEEKLEVVFILAPPSKEGTVVLE